MSLIEKCPPRIIDLVGWSNESYDAASREPEVSSFPDNTNDEARSAGVEPPVTPGPKICLESDLSDGDVYGSTWLLVDDQSLWVISDNNDGVRIQKTVRIQDIDASTFDVLTGCSSLVVRCKTGRQIELLRCTASRAAAFGGASRALESLMKGEEPPASAGFGVKRRICPTCGDPLPEDSDVCARCIDKRAVLIRLLAYGKPYKASVITIAVLMLAGTYGQLLPPILQKNLTDNVLVPHKHAYMLYQIVGEVVFFNFLAVLLSIWRGRLAAYVSNHMVYSIRVSAYEKLQELSLGYYDKRQVGSLMTRVTQDVNELQQFLVDGIQFFLVNSLQIIGIVLILFYFNPKLTLFVLIPVPVTIYLTRRVWKVLWGQLHRLFFLRSNLGGILNSVLSGVRVVKAFGQEDRETNRFKDKAFLLFNAGVTVEKSWATYFPLLGFITTFGVYIVWLGGGLQVVRNITNDPHKGMTLGVLGLFLNLIFMLMGPMQGMTRIADWLSRSAASAERVFEVIDAEPDVKRDPDPVILNHIEGRVQLKGVRFSYDKNQNVLQGVSIDVEPGEMIGLVGHSGAGKTTVINLISRFYDVQEGSVLIDGVDVRKIDRDCLRRQIGVVLQEPFLFPGTVSENIAYARPSASLPDIIRAAQAANAHDFIMNFADGYDTVVGERGARLSGGERQRLSIARAILHDPRILILDEATASVDTETEKQIQEAIGRLIHGRTTFAIAHRLSTLRNASRLMVMERGKLAELGTHDELLSNPQGIFRKLVDMQQEVNALREV